LELFYTSRIVRVSRSYNASVSSENNYDVSRIPEWDFCQSSRSKVPFEITLTGTALHLVSLYGNSCFATISARADAPTAIRFGLRESRLAYLGSFRFVLLRYSCRGNTRSEIQVSSRERSSLPPIAITAHRCARQHFFTFIFESFW